MKGTHVSKKSQRKWMQRNAVPYHMKSIPELSKLADSGDEKAIRQLRRLCG